MGESVLVTSKGLDSTAIATSEECMKRRENIDSREEDHWSDGRDEEEEDDTYEFDDPYTYSDDSISLSDAYFFPQPDDDLAKPRRYREADPLNSALSENGVPSNLSYGSLSVMDRAASPLWVGGSIQEDSEMIDTETMTPLTTAHALPAHLGRKARKQLKRHQRAMLRLQMKQREQVERERAVSEVKGQPQDFDRWKDLPFAIIFLTQLVIVIYCAMRFGFGVLLFEDDEGDDPTWLRKVMNWHWDRSLAKVAHTKSADQMHYADDDMYHQQRAGNHTASSQSSPLMIVLGTGEIPFTIEYQNVIALAGIAGFYACVLTYISFGFMLILSRALIPVMLVFSILLALAWGLIGLTFDPYGIISVLGFGALLLALAYTMYNWARIPFAATNLHTALCAVRCTADITILGLGSLIVSFGWCIVWTMAFIGIVNKFNSTECYRTDVCLPHFADRQVPIYMMLLFSFHWTNTVIKNVVRVTVAGSIGTWWFAPENVGPICTAAVMQPLLRAITKSFGSICFGSLVEGNIFVLHIVSSTICCLPLHATTEQKLVTFFAKHSAPKSKVFVEENAVLSNGLFHHLSSVREQVKQFIRCCNRWSYIYIGIYGYSFLEAGERAIQLFETREWMEVVRDNLIANVLMIASIIIGGSTGTFAVVVEETDGYEFTSLHKPLITAFIIGSVLGYVLSNILLLGLVSSAVNTVLVCFAAGPFEFDKKHARLSREMREVWSQQVWEPLVS